jgi:hypothetical protein
VVGLVAVFLITYIGADGEGLDQVFKMFVRSKPRGLCCILHFSRSSV